MSESVQPGVDGLRIDESTAQTPLSAGTILRQAREAAGVHIAVLAVSLKVSVAKLEALEADRLDELPDAVFARALAASVCRQLKIDPEVVLERLPQSAPRLVPDYKRLNTPFRALEEKSRAGLSSQLSRPMVMAVLAILLGALVLILLPSFSRHSGVAATDSVASLPAPTEQQADSTNKADHSTASPAVPVATPLPAAAPSVDAAVAAELPASAPLPSAQPGPADAASDAIIVFAAKGASWVQVTDAKGKAVLRKTLAPAEVVPVTGELPLTVVVGRADATSVQVRGKAFDLAPSTKNNVAHFEVK